MNEIQMTKMNESPIVTIHSFISNYLLYLVSPNVLSCVRDTIQSLLIHFFYKFQAQFVDILSFNSYEAWNEYTGDLDVIIPRIKDIANGWHDTYNKPVLITEYGADTQEGFHTVS